LIALAAVALMAARKKLGTSASTALAAVFILGMVALDFTGGRGISAADGADRLEAWANGLEMFKSAPIFGIGFNGFADVYEITAHNSFVLCLAELGVLGSTLWMALLVTTTMGLNRIIGVRKKRPGRFLGLLRLFEASSIASTGALAMSPAASEGIVALHYAHAYEGIAAEGRANITEFRTKSEPDRSVLVPRHWMIAMRLALVSFMASAWFLSRSYTTTMYLVVGLATAMIAIQQSGRKSPDRGRWIFSTVAAEMILIVLIYALVRLRH